MLDETGKYSDRELCDVLQRVHLIPSGRDEVDPSAAAGSFPSRSTNTNILLDLQSRISEGGSNLSQGQRQLVCLARAMLLDRKILILDEATSAVDTATDSIIQKSIRYGFQNKTIVVVAHRLSTIADFDDVIVIADGKVIEYGKPAVLMTNPNGAFRKLVEESGQRNELEAIIENNYKEVR